MPVIDTEKARTVMVIKRGMNPRFAGTDKELHYLNRALMSFGDAKSFAAELVKKTEVQSEGRGKNPRFEALLPKYEVKR